MQNETLSISLPAELAQLVRRTVETGAYASNSDVVRDALRLWEERSNRLQAIRTALNEAAADPARHSMEDVSNHFDRLMSNAERAARQ